MERERDEKFLYLLGEKHLSTHIITCEFMYLNAFQPKYFTPIGSTKMYYLNNNNMWNYNI